MAAPRPTTIPDADAEVAIATQSATAKTKGKGKSDARQKIIAAMTAGPAGKC